MSGGSFDYACFKAEESQYYTLIEDVKKIEAYLRELEKHAAADEVLIYCRNLEMHQRRILAEGKRIYGLLKAAEWVDSGDWGNESIDKAYNELMGIAEKE